MTIAMPMTVDEVSLRANGYPDRKEWRERIIYDDGNLLVPDDLIAKVEAVDIDAARKVGLLRYAAQVRYDHASGGVIFSSISGSAFTSDPVSRNAINARQALANNPEATCNWKMADGSFVTLNAEQITAVMQGMTGFVQTCFDCESNTATGINDGSITARAEIDAAFAAISNVFP